jgi:lipopolysaccharide export system protein LptA
MADFLRAAALTSLLADPVAAPPAGDVPRPDIQPDPAKTRITSDDGAFFDSKNGLLIFLKNVVVRDPRFQLSGADEVKVFFEPKEAAKPAAKPADAPTAKPVPVPAKKDDNPMGDASFGKPSRMVATGTVVVDYKSNDPAEPPLKASARTLVYDLVKKEIILRGGSPWVLRDGQLSSVPGNDAYIVIQKDGSFVTGNGGIDASVDTQGKPGDKKKTR